MGSAANTPMAEKVSGREELTKEEVAQLEAHKAATRPERGPFGCDLCETKWMIKYNTAIHNASKMHRKNKFIADNPGSPGAIEHNAARAKWEECPVCNRRVPELKRHTTYHHA